MPKRTFEEFIALTKKRYIILVVLLFIIALSGIVALICMLFQITLFSHSNEFINTILIMTWFIISIISCLTCFYLRKLFVQGKLDWVFGDNISDKKNKNYESYKNKNHEIEIQRKTKGIY